MVGKAITNESNQAFNQTKMISSTIPTFNKLTTKDMMHDISNDMKNEKAYVEYFVGSNFISC